MATSMPVVAINSLQIERATNFGGQDLVVCVVSCVCLTGAIDENAPKYPVLPNRFKRLFSLFQWK